MGIDIDVRFPGGKRVDTVFKNFTIATDQPQEEGGKHGAGTI